MKTKTYKMSVRLDPETREELRKRAEQERRNPSDLVRLWILDKLKDGNK